MNRTHPSRARGEKLASHASSAPSLEQRIADMEERLMLERAQAVAHSRAFGGTVKRRLTSPTSLVFACSMGYVAAEILSAQRASAKARVRRDGPARGKSGAATLQSWVKPLVTLLHLGSMGFLVKQGKESSETAQAVASSASAPTIH